MTIEESEEFPMQQENMFEYLAKLTHLRIKGKQPKTITTKEKDEAIIKIVMENTKNYLNLKKSPGDLTTADLTNFITEITPQIFNKLAIKHFVGIQPMTGPVSIIHLLEYVIEKKETSDLPTEALIPRRRLNVISSTVEAYSRKLQASWNIEAMQDLNAHHRLDLESEMTQAISYEIAKEIYTEVKNDILQVAHKHTIKLKDEYVPFNLQFSINYCANQIAHKTRRGAGNFVIVSETIADVLKDVMKTDESLIFNMYDYVNYVGTINETINVYCDSGLEHNKAIIGYKGNNTELDTGYIYAPYIPVMANIVVDPNTFAPVVSLMTRYGKHINQPTTTKNLEDGKTTVITKEPCNYYYELTFDNLPKMKKSENEKIVVSVMETADTNFNSAMGILD